MIKPIVGITMGDAAGIGPEICVKALTSGEVQRICKPIIIGDKKIIKDALKIAKLPNVDINPINKVDYARFIKGIIDVYDMDNLKSSKVKIGKISAACGKASVEYLKTAIKLAMDEEIDAITTSPINKEAINKAGFKYQGHTEILAEKTGAKNYAMMFISDTLWIMLVTTHLAIKDVSKNIDKKKVLSTIKLAHETVKKLRNKKPKIGVAGLNPHAGESGIFGDEEIKIIEPAIKEAKKMGIDVKGPISPDAIFYLANIGMFDIIVSMYHDQGLIPLKLLSFNRSVNVTAGLPIIRTSVDHGTGFDIAGKGWANPTSLIEAVKVATHFVHSTQK